MRNMSSETNWLSFSLSSSMEMPYDHPSAPPQYLVDNFFQNGWENQKSQVFYQEEQQREDRNVEAHNMNDSSMFNTFLSSQPQNQSVPKLEDFFSGDSETQISSLTHICDNSGSAYLYEHQDLNAIAGFQAFSSNSGSEVEDSASIGKTQLSESSGNDLGLSSCPNGALSLGVNVNANAKAVVSDCTKKAADTFGQRTSIYRGVTRHRWTGRYEAHLWDNSCRREGQARKGRQVYLGGYDKEEKAARSYDLAALKYWGPTATTNFPISSYTKELEEMKHVTKQEFIASLRRKSSGFSRGASRYRGVTRHHQQGRWQARIGRVAGNKDLYLGTFATEEEAAEAYDIAAIKFRGVNAVTNFEMNRYDVEAIMNSSLPVGGTAKRLKLSLESEQKPSINNGQLPHCSSSNINYATIQPIPCAIPYESGTYLYQQNVFPHLQLNTEGTSNSPGSIASVTPQTLMPMLSHPAEFFLWPYQSY